MGKQYEPEYNTEPYEPEYKSKAYKPYNKPYNKPYGADSYPQEYNKPYEQTYTSRSYDKYNPAYNKDLYKIPSYKYQQDPKYKESVMNPYGQSGYPSSYVNNKYKSV